MRIFRAERLSEIVGLHRNDLSFSIEFTAHALVKKWKISEFPIHYRDRVGESKLSILKDGFMFMAVVFQKALKRK